MSNKHLGIKPCITNEGNLHLKYTTPKLWSYLTILRWETSCVHQTLVFVSENAEHSNIDRVFSCAINWNWHLSNAPYRFSYFIISPNIDLIKTALAVLSQRRKRQEMTLCSTLVPPERPDTGDWRSLSQLYTC